MDFVLFVNIKNVRCGLWLTKPPINRLRLDYEVKINRLQNSLIMRAPVMSGYSRKREDVLVT